MVFGTNHSLSARPELNLKLTNVAVEPIEETRLLGVILDKLSWVRHIDCLVVKLGRDISIFFDITLDQTSLAESSLITSRLLFIWSNAPRRI